MSRKAKLLDLARKLAPDVVAKPKDPTTRVRAKVSFAAFQKSFPNVSRAHNYVVTILGVSIAIQPDTVEGWRALYDAAIRAETDRPIDTTAPLKARPNIIPGFDDMDEDTSVAFTASASDFLGAC